MRRRNDEGAVAVEAAMVVGLLLLISLGAFEYGMAFNNYFGLASSSREAARVGASIGGGASSGPNSAYDADCAIIEAAAAALNSSSNAEVVSITLTDWDPVNDAPAAPLKSNKYRPATAQEQADNDALLRCSTWYELAHTWSESDREPVSGPRPWIAVEVEFAHNWITGFLWWNGSVNWSNQNVMRVEPVNYG